ncbi:MAG: hypothetical protein FJ145_14540 [Deltaproteobacteria bacterium]|nr:hypothetical protein [Deltaproteobacteria bacterium]
MHVAIVRVFLALVIAFFSSSPAFGAEKALVSGTPTANLRVGPSVEQAIIVTLKEGDAVMVERLDGEWYQVTAAEGQRGFIHKNLLKFSEPQKAAGTPAKAGETKEVGKTPVPPNVPTPVANPKKSAEAPVTPTAVPPAPALVPSAPAAKGPVPLTVGTNAAAGKSRPLIDLLVGGGLGTAIWLGVAVLTFVLGWICGGIHSLRRERLKRSRLMF